MSFRLAQAAGINPRALSSEATALGTVRLAFDESMDFRHAPNRMAHGPAGLVLEGAYDW